MEWLIAHEDELNNEMNDSKNYVNTSTTNKPGESSATSTASDASKGQGETAANMAARKKITVEEAQKLIAKRLAVRAEEERKKAIEDEKKRRLCGQKMAETRAELQDLERIRLAEQIRHEKREKELHRKQVLDQIARDREAMKNKAKPLEQASQASSTSTTITKPTVESAPKNHSASECRLALRFPDGSNVVHKFSPREQLAAVRLFVQMQKVGAQASQIEFVAPPNKKLDNSMMNTTLETLGLCPASRLEVRYNLPTWDDLD